MIQGLGSGAALEIKVFHVLNYASRQSNAGVEVWLLSFSNLVLNKDEWSAARPARFTPGEGSQHPLNRRLGVSQSRFGRFGGFPQEIRTADFQSAA